MAMYTASKHGVKLISEALRQELSDAGSKIKISVGKYFIFQATEKRKYILSGIGMLKCFV